jgi:hypothetical protein
MDDEETPIMVWADCGKATLIRDLIRGIDGVVEAYQVCSDCERCTWNPSSGGCDQGDHPQCAVCGHCQYRHGDQDMEIGRFVAQEATDG